jgi:hypothetical protein
MDRYARLQSARTWLKTYNGKNIAAEDVKRGDSLYAIEPKNGVELTAYDPEFAKQVERLLNA